MRLLYTTILTLFFYAQLLIAQSFNTEVISIKLLEKMEESPTAFHSINVVLADRVDLVSLDAMLTAKRATAEKRVATVINALKEKAASTQGRVLDFLKNSPNVEKPSIKSYWIANALVAKAAKEVIAELSHNPEIEWIGLNGKLEYDKLEVVSPPVMFSPNGIEPGLDAIDAPKLWAMGYTGYGQLALTSDTGVDPTHPAIASQYSGHYVPAEQTWYDVNGNLTPTGDYTPFDCASHGTHVTGTMVGLDRLNNDTIGVAFNAHWIGAQTIVCDNIGTANNIGAFEWALDPDGNPNTVDDMPDVVNNSWRDPNVSGSECFSVYVPIFEATEAAGIAVIFSAGNEGADGIMSITPPKNILINEVNIFTVGALNANNLEIAGFSSLGSSHCPGDSTLQIKPEVSAPGVGVRSCVPGGGYENFEGTSMAAPHVSGAILLLKEAFPNLTGRDLKLALYHSCTDLGEPGEDNTYGMGIINVMDAFNYLVDQGNIPVSPYRANDVLLVNVFNPDTSCNGEIAPVVLVENAGTDTLFSFKVFYKAGVTEADFQWDGVLPPSERLSLTLPSVAVNSGTHVLSVGLEEPNGVQDERPLNNRFTTSVLVSNRPPFMAIVEGPTNTVCENTPALLRGVLPDNLQGHGAYMDIGWYDQPFDGSHLGNGEVFTTPLLSQDATFYAEVEYFVPVGAHSRLIGTAALLDTADVGLEFEVFDNLVLEKVHVFTEQTGIIRLELVNLIEDDTLKKINVVSSTGKNELNLSWELTPGIYRIFPTNGIPLIYNKNGATFPYEVEDLISIVGNTDGPGNDSTYYFFYDWEVSLKEICGRAPVHVEVVSDGNAPIADFTASSDTVSIDDNEAIDFTNNSMNGIAWQWNFGDGNSSNEENPSHTFAVPGEYVVSLTTVDSNGCSASTYSTILVEESTISNTSSILQIDKVVVYPNPVKERLSIYLDLPSFQNVSLRLADSTGRVWAEAKHQVGGQSSLEMEVNGFPPGVYFLLVETDNASSVWKVVKM